MLFSSLFNRKSGSDANRAVEGVPIVLTASRAEMSQFNLDPFLAFTCTFPHEFARLFSAGCLDSEPEADGRERFAPYSLRKIESLLAEAYGEENIAVAHYDNLDEFIGTNTKVVGISTMDPMGLAYVSTTYNSLLGFGGESLNAVEFDRLMKHPSLQRYDPRIVVGGAGVWQIRDAKKQEEYGIDSLILGECEHDAVDLFDDLLSGQPCEPFVTTSKPREDEIPTIRNAATYGSVEITRGCGRGCKFCSPTMRKRYSFPVEHIMEEVALNIANGSKMIFTTTEDMFLYKAHKGFKPNREAIVDLYRNIADYPGVEMIGLSHASLAPIVYDETILEELTPILMEKTRWTPEYRKNYTQRFITVEVGIETGSVRLMNKFMAGKALPYSVDHWPELVCQGIGHMNDHDWWPLCTFMTGMPDETEEDVIATLELLDDLKGANMFYTPLLFIPLEEALLGKANRISFDHISELQWEVLTRCWQYNIDFWLPEWKYRLRGMAFLHHWLIARWKHGKKSTRPMMRLMGFPERFFGQRVGKGCEAPYCADPKQITDGTAEESSV